jgi:hypothetical protein
LFVVISGSDCWIGSGSGEICWIDINEQKQNEHLKKKSSISRIPLHGQPIIHT